MIPAIDLPTMDALSLADLVQRMDAILRSSVIERYGAINKGYCLNLVSQFMETARVLTLPERTQRHLAHIVFSYLVQFEMALVIAGISNRLLFDNSYDENSSWHSPLFQLRHGALQQYQIVSSRIAMEIFMDILYCIDKGQRLKAKHSKLGTFRKWLCDPSNQFHYFAHTLLTAYRFDRKIRTPEVHGTPKLPKRLLSLQKPSHNAINECYMLTNALLGCWQPLLELLNGKKPCYMNIGEADMEWFRAYMTGTDEEIENKLRLMFQGTI